MDIIDYLLGRGGFMILALIVVIILLYNKVKARREFGIKTKNKKNSVE